MRNPFRTTAQWIVQLSFSLLVIVTILLGYKFLHDQYAKFEHLENDRTILERVHEELVGIRDKVVMNVLPRIPPPGSPLNLLAEQINGFESELATKRATRQALRSDHPIDRYLPTSQIFQQIAALDIEIAFTEQGLDYVRAIHSFIAGPEAAKRKIGEAQVLSQELAGRIFKNKNDQWELTKKQPLLWQVPFTAAHRAMKSLEKEANDLENDKSMVDQGIDQQQKSLQSLLSRAPLPQFAFDQGAASRVIQPVTDRMAEIDKLLDGSNAHKFLRPIYEILPTALWILALALLSPLLVKSITYYMVAPVAARCLPVRLLPDSSGSISGGTGASGRESNQTKLSGVSLSLLLDEQSKLLMLPRYLQGAPLNARMDTQWLLDWSIPFTSLIAGMYGLMRIRPVTAERITVSSSTDPLAEFSLIDVPAGAALVLQPSCLVGVILTGGNPLKITRHWRFRNLGAWLTLQFRYIVFHGPAKLIVKGCRGVRVEPVATGRAINQAATLGFSANLDYSVARNGTFPSYLFGERDLFNDCWNGNGCCVHAETPHPDARSGFFGRGIEGLVDTFLKIFGI